MVLNRIEFENGLVPAAHTMVEEEGAPLPDPVPPPHMPEVRPVLDIEAVFADARWHAAGSYSGTRGFVLVTPDRKLIFYPSKEPGTADPELVKGIEQTMPSDTPRNVFAIAATEPARLALKDLARTIPFVGFLRGFAYVGLTVVVFEGHDMALAAGCRDGDVLIVDADTMTFLRKDWAGLAWQVMRTPTIYVYHRDGRVDRLVKAGPGDEYKGVRKHDAGGTPTS